MFIFYTTIASPYDPDITFPYHPELTREPPGTKRVEQCSLLNPLFLHTLYSIEGVGDEKSSSVPYRNTIRITVITRMTLSNYHPRIGKFILLYSYITSRCL